MRLLCEYVSFSQSWTVVNAKWLKMSQNLMFTPNHHLKIEVLGPEGTRGSMMYPLVSLNFCSGLAFRAAQ